MKKMFTGWDVILISFLLVVSLVFMAASFAWGTQNASSASYKLGDKTGTFDLSEDKEIKLHNHDIDCTIEILDGRIRVKEAGCPDKLCQNKGWVENSSSSIACVPMGLFIEVKGQEGGDFDALNR